MLLHRVLHEMLRSQEQLSFTVPTYSTALGAGLVSHHANTCCCSKDMPRGTSG